MKLQSFTILGTLFLCASVLFAQPPIGDIIVQADGYGASKKAALLDAKRNAVEQGIGTVIISETEMNLFVVQKDIVISKTLGAVKKYDIVKEEKSEAGDVQVSINAVVSLASIKADLAALKILLESMDKPRMMVVIKEKHGNTAESTILDFLSEKGVELVDPAVVAALMQKNDELINKATLGDPMAAAKIGTSNGAEYVIVGNVSKSQTENDMLRKTGMNSGQAAITAKVVNCSNGKIIAAKMSNSAFAHVSGDMAETKATEKAANKLMDQKLFEKIVSSFQDMINNGIALDVIIKRVDNFKMQKAIRKVIGNLPRTVSVNKRRFGGGLLTLSVQYKGNADSFGEAMDGKTVKNKTFSVTDITGDKVVIDLE